MAPSDRDHLQRVAKTVGVEGARDLHRMYKKDEKLISKSITAFFGSIMTAAFLLYATTANAVTITFETDAGGNPIPAPIAFASTNPLTTLFQPLGVTWAGGGAILDFGGGFGVFGFSPRNFLGYNSFASFQGGAPVQASDTMTFTTGLSAISFLAGSSSPPGRILSVTARDAGNQIIGSVNLTLQSSLQLVSILGTGIVTVDYSLPGNSGVFVIDDLNFTPQVPEPGQVPEPATLTLFGLGLAGLGYMRRRRAI